MSRLENAKTHYDIHELIEQVRKLDLEIKPYALVCNPIHEEILKKEFGDQYEILASPLVDRDQILAIDRKKYNELTGGIVTI